MKNTFNDLIEKCKNLWNIIQQNKKLKYGVIAGLVGVLIITLGIFTALGIKEASNVPSNESAVPAISEYDNVTVIQIGDDESDTDTENETSVEPDESESDSESAADDSDETSSDDETGEGTEDTENVQGDNEGATVNDDPAPAGPSNSNQGSTGQPDNTPSKNTQGTTNNPANTQSTIKPPVTTQTTTKPAETTKPAQTTTKPAETTKPTQTTTKPVETTKPAETPTGFVVKEKKYDYKNGNVMILDVTNNTSRNYTITINATYKDASGKTLKTESKTFEGFPAGWSNYFVFNPGIKFDSFEIGMNAKDFKYNTFANYLKAGDKVELRISRALSDGSGEFIIPTSPEQTAQLKQYASVWCHFSNMYTSYSGAISYQADLVVFDGNGDICFIGTPGIEMNISYSTESFGTSMPMFVTNVLWENKEQYKLPDNLKKVTGIMAIKFVQEY